MSDHLTTQAFAALTDGELAAAELVEAQEHLTTCSGCTARALEYTLLKTATARAGQRYMPPPELPEELKARMKRLLAEPANTARTAPHLANASPTRWSWSQASGWATAAIFASALAGVAFYQRGQYKGEQITIERAVLGTDIPVVEIADLHIATLAANQPPQVLSSDRHTVKPWFQGKIPFTFNLPEDLPADTRLEGANLIYLRNRPAAQLVYSIGRHRVSVFVEQRTSSAPLAEPPAEDAGFHFAAFTTPELHAVAISDVEPSRLEALIHSIEQAQPAATK